MPIQKVVNSPQLHRLVVTFGFAPERILELRDIEVRIQLLAVFLEKRFHMLAQIRGKPLG